MIRKRIAAAVAVAAALIASATAITTATSPTAQAAASVPVFDHIVLVMFENHAYSQINGSSSAPYFNCLAGQGAKFTQSYGVTHPSQPNYLALFSGSTQGVTDDSCPHDLQRQQPRHAADHGGQDLQGLLRDACPPTATPAAPAASTSASTTAGSTSATCRPPATSDFTAFPSSTNYATLPDRLLRHPEHVQRHARLLGQHGRHLAKNNLDAYAQWAKTHNSLLIVTFDEDNGGSSNHILTTFVGAHTQVGTFTEPDQPLQRAAHDRERVRPLASGNVGSARITDVWN